LIVQAHGRDRTISAYVAGILDRQVPDHRIVRAEAGGDDAARQGKRLCSESSHKG
jgi:hypothetical protein